MESETFRSRIHALLQKSRKAIRLYTTMGGIQGEVRSEFQELQVQEWKSTNSDLLKQLTIALDSPNTKGLVGDMFAVRDHFYSKWRMSESELHVKQKELLHAAESGDFIKAALCSSDLISLKARVQAAQAAHHEIDEVINRSKVALPPLELPREQEIREQPLRAAKVIPLRKQMHS